MTEPVAADRPQITVVGLGPGDHRHVTAHTLEAIARCPHRYLRTAVHPSAHLVPDAHTFDHLYDRADTFAEVYERIHLELRDAALRHGRVLYAVPGSPLILERSVTALRADPELDVEVLPALSFLDLVYERLRIDPVEAGVRLVDGHRFGTDAAGERGPLLVAHLHAAWVMSEVKLAIDDTRDELGDPAVVVLQRLGTDRELITETTWSMMDRDVEPDHLTSMFIPELAVPVAAEYQRFHQLARTLRERCPWDIEQTHLSLIPHLIEETYEVVDAIGALDPDDPLTDEHLVEELGDLLYQIEFHATIAEQEGRFTIADVARGVHDKLVRRHPHVFASGSPDTSSMNTAQVLDQWEAIKRTEKGRTSALDGVPASLPALSYARKVQSKAAKVGFDWDDVHGALPKIAEEAAELLAAPDQRARLDELGDLLFAVVNVARHLDLEPEAALRLATEKFRQRFEWVEGEARRRGLELHSCDLETLDALWAAAKDHAADGARPDDGDADDGDAAATGEPR